MTHIFQSPPQRYISCTFSWLLVSERGKCQENVFWKTNLLTKYLWRFLFVINMDRIAYTGIYGRILRLDLRKVIKQFFVVLFGPISTYGFYHYDLITDTLQTINLFNNCHYNYGMLSISFILISYLTTALHLIFFLKKDKWIALAYPYHHVYG